MKALYHYCTMHQLSTGQTSYRSGTLVTEGEINTTEMASVVRKAIADDVGCPNDQLIICSLTLLNPGSSS